MHIFKIRCILTSFLHAFSALGQKNGAPDFEILVYSDFLEFEGNYYLKNEAGQLIEMLIEDVKH